MRLAAQLVCTSAAQKAHKRTQLELHICTTRAISACVCEQREHLGFVQFDLCKHPLLAPSQDWLKDITSRARPDRVRARRSDGADAGTATAPQAPLHALSQLVARHVRSVALPQRVRALPGCRPVAALQVTVL